MDNLDSCDAFNIAVELFRAHWNPMYPHQMTAFMATPYALGAHSKWFTGMFNHQNTPRLTSATISVFENIGFRIFFIIQ